MGGIQVSVPHRLGRDAAQARVAQFLDKVRQDYAHEVSDVSGDWNDNRLSFAFATRGLTIRGTLVVLDQEVQVSGPLPFAAMFFRGRIEQTIREQLDELLR